MKQLPQDGMIELTAKKFGKTFPAMYQLIQVGLDSDDRVRWLLCKAHGDAEGLLAALTMAYAGLADIVALDLMRGRGGYAGLYQATLAYAGE